MTTTWANCNNHGSLIRIVMIVCTNPTIESEQLSRNMLVMKFCLGGNILRIVSMGFVEERVTEGKRGNLSKLGRDSFSMD